jgi:ABC-type branched-subunit amino acid transport system ATPase component/branched-subunit amino acid ABC-type transport system permease component
VDKLLNLVLLGAVTGAIYSVMASGLVLTYSTSGIFNFAHGAVAFVVAYLYYQLHTGLGVPIVPALIASAFIFGPLLGLLLDRVLLRRLSQAPVYAKVVGTIGLLVALPNMAEWLFVTVGNTVFHLGLAGNTATDQGLQVAGLGPNPADEFNPMHGVAINSDQVAVFIIAALAAVGLWVILRKTRLGLEMRAVVDREPLAGLRGVNPGRTSSAAWVLTMLLAGLGGILIAPLFSLDPNTFTLVVLGALAAVVLGGLRSLPIAFVGGLALGIIQNLVAGYSNSLPSFLSNLTGLRSAVPYLLVIVLGLIIGRDRTRGAGSVADSAPPSDHRRGLSAWRRRLPWVLATAALVAFSMQWLPISFLKASTYDQTIIAQSLATAVILLSFVVVTGMGGMVSLAQATFVTAGGFAVGWALNRNWGIDVPLIASHGQLNFALAAIIAVVVAAALGALIAWPATRLGAVYLAIWSLAAAFFFSLVPFANQAIGHGSDGWTIRSPTLALPGLSFVHQVLTPNPGPFDFSQLPDQILLFLAVFGVITAAIHALLRSTTGRSILAVRSSEIAAEAAGIRANRTKILIFALAAGVAGLGGVMLSLFSFSASNSTAPPIIGMMWLAIAVVYGVRRPGGALLAGFSVVAGAAILQGVGSLLPGTVTKELIGSAFFLPIISGMGAMVLAQEPDGILALAGWRNRERSRAREQRDINAAEAAMHGGEVPDHERVHLGEPVSVSGADGAALSLRGIVAGYRDVEVVHGVDLDLQPGQVVALLGANGAGKSTLCAIAAGLLQPTHGTVTVHGEDVTSWPAYRRARQGVLLVPEARGIFPGLTVEENLAVFLRSAEDRELAYERLPTLATRRGEEAGNLSGGEQQMLSLAPALVLPPKILIADEPTLGLAPLMAEEMMRAVLEVRDQGSAVLLVEEHAHNALELADVLAFMELGGITWVGPRDQVDLEQLSSAYLGKDPRSTNGSIPTPQRPQPQASARPSQSSTSRAL